MSRNVENRIVVKLPLFVGVAQLDKTKDMLLRRRVTQSVSSVTEATRKHTSKMYSYVSFCIFSTGKTNEQFHNKNMNFNRRIKYGLTLTMRR